MAVEQTLQCALVLFSRIADLRARMESGLGTGRACGLHGDAIDPFGYLHSGFVCFHKLKPLLRPAAWAACWHWLYAATAIKALGPIRSLSQLPKRRSVVSLVSCV